MTGCDLYFSLAHGYCCVWCSFIHQCSAGCTDCMCCSSLLFGLGSYPLTLYHFVGGSYLELLSSKCKNNRCHSLFSLFIYFFLKFLHNQSFSSRAQDVWNGLSETLVISKLFPCFFNLVSDGLCVSFQPRNKGTRLKPHILMKHAMVHLISFQLSGGDTCFIYFCALQM